MFYPLRGAFPTEYARREDEARTLHMTEKNSTSLNETMLEELAEDFGNSIPEGEFSAAQIQGKCPGLLLANSSLSSHNRSTDVS